MSYVGTHPSGRRLYVESKTGVPLAFAVFVCDTRRQPQKWERVAVVEERALIGEMHRVNGSYVPYDGPMAPQTKAEEIAKWYREVIGNHITQVVALREAVGARRSLP